MSPSGWDRRQLIKITARPNGESKTIKIEIYQNIDYYHNDDTTGF